MVLVMVLILIGVAVTQNESPRGVLRSKTGAVKGVVVGWSNNAQSLGGGGLGKAFGVTGEGLPRVLAQCDRVLCYNIAQKIGVSPRESMSNCLGILVFSMC